MEELAKIKPFVFDDRVTGDTVEVRTSEGYSAVLRINDRHYYFTKETGEMDGTSFEVGYEDPDPVTWGSLKQIFAPLKDVARWALPELTNDPSDG